MGEKRGWRTKEVSGERK
jgi:hypothetical protein